MQFENTGMKPEFKPVEASRLDINPSVTPNKLVGFLREKTTEVAETTKFYTTYEERLNKAPALESSLGEYLGPRGESEFRPYDEGVQRKLSEYGVDSISYRDAIPDFRPVAGLTIVLEAFSTRSQNFRAADTMAARKWNEVCKDGKSDWTAREVANWRQENGFTWHECSDMKTCMLVSSDIHAVCRHSGAHAEYKAMTGHSAGSETGLYDA